ncbi:MAG: glycosyltransferase family 2 protein [Muribaculaceae bacterium]|nr:glycosyltransferase family 2 protein [Muribaculaceae bacterium]
MKEKVSVIIPVHNREELVKRSLDSIISQTVLPFEIIVVDNASSDNTYSNVKSWMKRYIHKGVNLKLLTENKRGACAARQKGLENAEGDFLIFFDSDDEMHPDLLESAIEAVKNNKDTDIVCWKSRIHKLDGSTRIPPFMPDNAIEGHLIHTLLRPQGYMVRKDFLIKAGGWTKDIKVWNDFELGLRLLLLQPKIIGIDKVMSEIYAQPESITGSGFSQKEGEWEITLREMEKTIENSRSEGKERIERILDYRRAILAAHYYREGNKKAASLLMQEALNEKGIKEKILLLFSYLYTRKGWRGAWRLVGPAYRI